MAQSTVDDIRLPQEVIDFCTQRGLSADLQLAISFAHEFFDPIRKLSVALEIDPETGDYYVVVNVCRSLPVNEALSRRRVYTTRWVQSASPEAIEKIRMVTDIS